MIHYIPYTMAVRCCTSPEMMMLFHLYVADDNCEIFFVDLNPRLQSIDLLTGAQMRYCCSIEAADAVAAHDAACLIMVAE